jgi:hypothetical protein
MKKMIHYITWFGSIEGNYVMSYLRGDTVVRPVFVDHNNILGFKSNTLITGINIIDDMLFWTDNKTEPKKINIPRSRQGTPTFNNHTKFINKGRGFNIPGNSPEAEEKHITVIKKGPNTPLRLQLGTSRNPDKIYTGVITITNDPATSDIVGPQSANFSSFSIEDGSNTLSLAITEAIDQGGNIVAIGPVNDPNPASTFVAGVSGLTGWWNTINPASGTQDNILVGTKIVLKPFVEDNGSYVPPGLPVTDYVIKAEVIDAYPASTNTTWSNGIRIKIISIDGYPPVVPDGETELKYVVDLWDETEKLFEFKFPRFSYRYKYEDGEYSTFAPWTPVAFQPGAFDYHPRKGYNLGMTNRVNKVDLFGLVNSSTPKDVTSIDILFKDESSPNIYVVDTIRPDDYALSGNMNKWNSILGGNSYSIEKETINSVVPSNQLLRPWDNVPRKALAQDVTGNRIVYGNYVQNYDLLFGGYIGFQEKYVPRFTFEWGEYKEFEYVSGTLINTRLSGTGKSIKSLREYQLGVVFVDKYGRETPVISNETGTKKLEKGKADKYNRINVSINTNSGFPNHEDLKYFKFYLKETSGEYYNMAMDRWYDAEDGNVWLAFPSSDRNKVDIDTFLILKKGTDTDDLVTDAARYKIIAIENEAPDFIKTRRQLAVSIAHSVLKDVYGATLGDGPIQGRDSFELNYEAFLTTPGMHLDEYKEGKLYIEWEDPITKQVSDRYEIVSIDNDFDNGIAATNFLPLSAAKYSVQLDKDLGDDVNFITDDPTGINATKINYGIKTNIYKYTIQNRPQFDGRFFVKIYEDETFQANIEKSFTDSLGYRILNSKKVFYMKPLHKAIHTENIDDFLVSGSFTSPFDLENVADNIGRDSGYGYYEIREFASMALFFRRYAKGVLGAPNVNDQLLAHLRPGAAVANNANAGNTNSWLGNNVATVDLNMTYMGESWTPATNWNYEYGAHGGTGTAQWDGGYTNHFAYTPIIANQVNFHEKTETVHTQADNARDTEVWFIDAGPYAGSAHDYNGDGDFTWSSMNKFEQYSGGPTVSATTSNYNVMNDPSYIPTEVQNIDDLNTSADNINLNKGIVDNAAANTHSMNLAFGGIKGAKDANSSPGFFNIGNWNTSGGAVNNNNYPNLDDFVANFNSGIKFRWKQDPTQEIYTIGGNIQSTGYVRHSSIFSQTIASTNPSSNEDPGATSMAELLSFNFTKNWKLNDISPSYDSKWDPLFDGKIPNSLEITLKTCSWAGTLSSGATATGSTVGGDLKIFVTDIVGNSNYTGNTTLKVGMAFSEYTRQSGALTSVLSYISNSNSSPAGANDFLVIRRIEALGTSAGTTYYALTLGGYREPLRFGEHALTGAVKQPKINTDITFVQVGMNGYSPNSEFNINTIAHSTTYTTPTTSQWGAVTAVGYDIEFIEYIEPEEILSENPAIFETEPKELPELDIYYEASADIPMVISEDTVSTAFPIGSVLEDASTFYNVVGYDGSRVLVQPIGIVGAPTVTCTKQDGLEFNPTITNVQTVSVIGLGGLNQAVVLNALGNYDSVEFSPNLHDLNYKLNWHNCYSFGNGVESNRVRDNYNLPYIANGVKVSTTLEYDYKEEHRKYGLIYSGLYNATSGVNNLNQFIQAEKITKDINPIYGSIQKLHARDADLVTLCEDKILKILSQKDALYNADGNINLTATERVLGQAIPFTGEYGISTNPESFASENYRAYFADRARGAVLRLSMDGLTPISDAGMGDWFRDNLKLVDGGRIIGSYDDRNDEYVLKLEFPIYGCTNPLADNYDPAAVIDDGSCYGAISYNCVNGGCVLDSTGLGQYSTLQDCQANCNPDSWDCVNGGCVLDSTGLGQYSTLQDCQASCNVVTYTCTYTPPSQGGVGWGCYNMGYGTGNYTTLADCQTNCGLGGSTYECMGGYCIPTYQLSGHPGIGTYGDLAACQASCTLGSPNTWNYVGCTDSNATNYDVNATADDGSCIYPISGCTDPTALNQNLLATIDDGSCIYGTSGGPGSY